jgi:hypothetical protein
MDDSNYSGANIVATSRSRVGVENAHAGTKEAVQTAHQSHADHTPSLTYTVELTRKEYLQREHRDNAFSTRISSSDFVTKMHVLLT